VQVVPEFALLSLWKVLRRDKGPADGVLTLYRLLHPTIPSPYPCRPALPGSRFSMNQRPASTAPYACPSTLSREAPRFDTFEHLCYTGPQCKGRDYSRGQTRTAPETISPGITLARTRIGPAAPGQAPTYTLWPALLLAPMASAKIRRKQVPVHRHRGPRELPGQRVTLLLERSPLSVTSTSSDSRHHPASDVVRQLRA
jgi:hypothetical protein